MSGVHSNVCPSCTCQAGCGYCDAKTVRLHETFSCLSEANHPMPHRGMLVYPPCPACGGLEDHSDVCPTGGFSDESSGLCEVQWVDGDDEPQLVPFVPGDAQ